jgi:hypothetical protein
MKEALDKYSGSLIDLSAMQTLMLMDWKPMFNPWTSSDALHSSQLEYNMLAVNI